MPAFICILAAIAGAAIGSFFAMFSKKEGNSRKLGAFLASLALSAFVGGIIGYLNTTLGLNLGLPVALALPADLLFFVIVLCN